MNKRELAIRLMEDLKAARTNRGKEWGSWHAIVKALNQALAEVLSQPICVLCDQIIETHDTIENVNGKTFHVDCLPF